jgi:hypothetical protein
MTCQIGDKPTIKYKFAGQSEKRYKSQLAPIELIQKSVPIPASNNYNRQGYGLRVWPVNIGQYVTGAVLDHEVFHSPYYPFFDTVSSITCGVKDYTILSPQDCENARLEYAKCRADCYDIDPSKTVTIDNTVSCPVPMEEKCSLQVLYNNLVIFQDQGNCPLEAEIICGNCADGEIECKTTKYPGYCCIPCASTAATINNLASKIR